MRWNGPGRGLIPQGPSEAILAQRAQRATTETARLTKDARGNPVAYVE